MAAFTAARMTRSHAGAQFESPWKGVGRLRCKRGSAGCRTGKRPHARVCVLYQQRKEFFYLRDRQVVTVCLGNLLSPDTSGVYNTCNPNRGQTFTSSPVMCEGRGNHRTVTHTRLSLAGEIPWYDVWVKYSLYVALRLADKIRIPCIARLSSYSLTVQDLYPII